MGLLEVSDVAGARCTVLNMVDMGTTFQQLHVIREGRNATRSAVLKALCDRWIAWAGLPKQLVTDPGLHFRGVLYTAQISQWTRCTATHCPVGDTRSQWTR